MSYRDASEWIQKVDEMGELKLVEGADWNLEIGALSVWHRSTKKTRPPCCSTASKTIRRASAFSSASSRACAGPRSQPIYPSTLAAKILQNVYQDEDINLFKFPVPFWHKRDGGRYIGTGHVVITRDRDDGWVNVGCYRVMVHDHNTLGMNISPGKHGRMHRQKYFDSGKPCPVAACFGVDPLLHMIATRPEPYGKWEFDAAGGIKGVPIEVIEGEYTGLPIPAYAEIAVEAEMLPDQGKEEGPFSEWTGY